MVGGGSTYPEGGMWWLLRRGNADHTSPCHLLINRMMRRGFSRQRNTWRRMKPRSRRFAVGMGCGLRKSPGVLCGVQLPARFSRSELNDRSRRNRLGSRVMNDRRTKIRVVYRFAERPELEVLRIVKDLLARRLGFVAGAQQDG